VFKIKIIINENKKNLSFQNKRHNAQLLIFLATAAANFFLKPIFWNLFYVIAIL